MKKLFLYVIPIIVQLCFFSPAFSEEAPAVVATVEVTGSRLAEETLDVPAPAYVITSRDIELSGARSTQELLERVPGVMGLINGASMTQSKGITIRGLNTEVLLLVDGVPAMNASYGVGAVLGSPFDLRSVSPGMIDRIEVVKGASSAVYGSNAAAGVINVITQKSGEESGGALLLEGGGAGWFRGTARGTAALENGARITVGYTRTQEDDTRVRLLPNGEYDRARDFRGDDYLMRVDRGAWSFVAEAGRYDSEWDYTTINTFVVPHSYSKALNSQENDYLRFLLSYNDGRNAARVYYRGSEREIYDAGGGTNYDEDTLGATFSRRQELFGLPAVFGLDWRRESVDYENRDNPYGNSNPFDLARNGFAPFIELSLPLGELALDVGLRYEHWSVDGGDSVDEFIPRLSLSYEDAQGGLWYLSAGRFFSMPSFYQMFYSELYWTPNPNLKPEKGWSYDLGFKNMRAKNPWSVSVFYMEMKDKIYYESDPVTWMGQYINVDEYRAWGVEAEVRFNLDEKWAYTQGFSWIKADEKKSGADWTRSNMPRWDLSGRFNYSEGPWSGEVKLNWLLDRYIDNNRFGYNDKNIFLVDASVAWQKDRDRVRVACLNLFDREHVLDREGYLTPERRFVISYERTF